MVGSLSEAINYHIVLGNMENNDPLGVPSSLLVYLTATEGSIFGVGQTSDYANWTGRIINAYSTIEFAFYQIYAVLAKEHPKVSFTRFYKTRSVRSKELLVLSVSGNLPEVYRKSLNRLCGRLRAAADRRTQVAHCILIKRSEKLQRVRQVGEKCFVENISKEYFARTMGQFRTLLTDVKVFLLYLWCLHPRQYQERLIQIPLPPHDGSEAPVVSLGPIPQHVESELEHCKRKIGLGSVLALTNHIYPRAKEYHLYFGEYLVLPMWLMENDPMPGP